MNLQDIFSRFNVESVTNHKNIRKGWLGVDCPYCSPGHNKFKMGFEISSGRCNCWTCGRCNAVQTLAILCRIPMQESYEIWQGMPRLQFTEPPKSGHLVLPEAGPLLPAHLHYLQKRGFDPEEISRLWGIKGIGLSSKLPWRILIPIFDRYGRAVSWTSRSIGNDNPNRYRSAGPEEESVPHKSILYGAHLARHSIVICEGPTDAWAIGPGAVATCGVGFSQSQMAAMSEYTVRVVCFDSQDEAQSRAEELCKNLSALPGVTENVLLETGKDPAECDKEEIEELRNLYLS